MALSYDERLKLAVQLAAGMLANPNRTGSSDVFAKDAWMKLLALEAEGKRQLGLNVDWVWHAYPQTKPAQAGHYLVRGVNGAYAVAVFDTDKPAWYYHTPPLDAVLITGVTAWTEIPGKVM